MLTGLEVHILLNPSKKLLQLPTRATAGAAFSKRPVALRSKRTGC